MDPPDEGRTGSNMADRVGNPPCALDEVRHLDPRDRLGAVVLTQIKHYLEMADVVFKSRKSEVIADLLHAWVTGSIYKAPTYTLFGFYIRHLVGLHDVVPFSPRLRRLVIRSIECIG